MIEVAEALPAVRDCLKNGRDRSLQRSGEWKGHEILEIRPMPGRSHLILADGWEVVPSYADFQTGHQGGRRLMEWRVSTRHDAGWRHLAAGVLECAAGFASPAAPPV